MPGCECQHCANDNDGVKGQANRISMAQVVAFHLDQSATKGANPLPDMCNVCVLKYQIKLSQRGYYVAHEGFPVSFRFPGYKDEPEFPGV